MVIIAKHSVVWIGPTLLTLVGLKIDGILVFVDVDAVSHMESFAKTEQLKVSLELDTCADSLI